MSERTANESWERRLPLYSYLEPLWAGRKVLELGCGSGACAEYLVAHGAARVVSLDSDQALIERARARFRRPNLEFRAVAHLADLAKLGESFDVVLVPAADALLLRSDVIAAWKRILADGGRLVVAVGNADRTGPAGGALSPGSVGYYQLTDALSPHFSRVQMFGQTPFLGVGMIEFDAPAEGLRVDTRLLEGEGEPASHYVAIAGAGEAAPLGYALVQVPFAPLEARLRAGQEDKEREKERERDPSADGRRDLTDRRVEEADRKGRARLEEAEGRISELRRRLDDAIVQSESAMRIARAQGEEIEDLRARLRRATDDRTALDGELAKLRRALAEADESVMALTRRTAEEMTAVAERLSVSLRAPDESLAGKAYLAEVAALRDHAEELRVRLAETESRAAAAERRLEETATASRDRDHETVDLRARLRRAEDSLERERLAVSSLQEQARIAGSEIEQLAGRASTLHDRDERIARLEGEKQDLAWRTAELEEKLRTAIARAVSLEATRGGPSVGGPMLASLPPPPPPAPAYSYKPAFSSAPAPASPSVSSPSSAASASAASLAALREELAAARVARDRSVEEFHRAAATQVDEVTRLQGLGERAVGAGRRARGVAARRRGAGRGRGRRRRDVAQERARAGRGRSHAALAPGRARGEAAAARAREEGRGAGRRRQRGARAQAAGGRDRARAAARRAGSAAQPRRRARGGAARRGKRPRGRHVDVDVRLVGRGRRGAGRYRGGVARGDAHAGVARGGAERRARRARAQRRRRPRCRS